MLSKLSRRERALIYVLAALLVVAGVFYGVLAPMNARHAALRAEIAWLEAQVNTMQTALAGGGMAAGAEAALSARLLPPMTAREADLLLTGLMEAAGLEVQALALWDAPGYRTAEITATGGLQGLETLLDSVAGIRGLAVTGVGYTTQGAEPSFTLGFALYSHAPAE